MLLEALNSLPIDSSIFISIVTPQWVTEPQDVSVLLGNPVLVGCSAKGFPEPQITWLKGQGNYSRH